MAERARGRGTDGAPVRRITAAAARRFLVRRHLLAPPRALPAEPASVLAVLGRIGSLQFDPLDVCGRNHDLVLVARIAGYRRAWTEELLYGTRELYETYNKQLSIVPSAELPWYRETWDRLRAEHAGGAFDEHATLVEELVGRIRDGGPIAASDLEPRGEIAWYWRPTNPVRAILEALAEAGILGIRRREGNRRVYDLVERLFPAPLLAARIRLEEQRRHRLLSRYRGHGLLGPAGDASLWAGVLPRGRGEAAARAALRAGLVERGALVSVEVEGFRDPRFVVAGELPVLDAAADEVAEGATLADPGAVLLAPLDPLAWDRDLLERLWGFHYRWEVYVPAARRRWGYYVLPLLHGDRFVGRIEPRADRAAGILRILGTWWEPGVDPLDGSLPALAGAVADALEAHLAFAGLREVAWAGPVRRGTFAASVRDRLGAGRMAPRGGRRAPEHGTPNGG